MADSEIDNDLYIAAEERVAKFAELEQNFVNLVAEVVVVEYGEEVFEHLVAEFYLFGEDVLEELYAVPQRCERRLHDITLLLQTHQQAAQNLLAGLAVDVRFYVFELLADKPQRSHRRQPDTVLLMLRILC